MGFTCDVVACIMYDVFLMIFLYFNYQRHLCLERIIFLRGPLGLQKTVGNLLFLQRLCVENTDLADSDGINITKSVQESQISLTPYEKTSPIWIGLMME